MGSKHIADVIGAFDGPSERRALSESYFVDAEFISKYT
jgi:hypothetical protein